MPFIHPILQRRVTRLRDVSTGLPEPFRADSACTRRVRNPNANPASDNRHSEDNGRGQHLAHSADWIWQDGGSSATDSRPTHEIEESSGDLDHLHYPLTGSKSRLTQETRLLAF